MSLAKSITNIQVAIGLGLLLLIFSITSCSQALPRPYTETQSDETIEAVREHASTARAYAEQSRAYSESASRLLEEAHQLLKQSKDLEHACKELTKKSKTTARRPQRPRPEQAIKKPNTVENKKSNKELDWSPSDRPL
jgi:hypothetical protein